MFHPKGPTLLELVKQGLSSTKRGYDLLAKKFDFTPFMTPRNVVKATAEYLKSEGPFDSAIDLCTGTGAGIEAFLSIVRRKIVGIDWSEPMLAEARNKFPDNSNGPMVRLVCEDIFELRYRKAFDLATCFGALGHIERSRQKEFVAIVHSLLRPGGLFAFVTFERPSLFSLSFWRVFCFDVVMRIRNVLIKPQFIMYYLNFLIPEALTLFDGKKWSRTKIVPIKIAGKPTKFRLVVAKKR